MIAARIAVAVLVVALLALGLDRWRRVDGWELIGIVVGLTAAIVAACYALVFAVAFVVGAIP